MTSRQAIPTVLQQRYGQMLPHVANGQARRTADHVMRQFAPYVLIAVGVFCLWRAGVATSAWTGCVSVSGFAACEAPAKAADDVLGGIITLGLGLLYQNRNEER